jgi:hypothetical protein
MFTSFSYKVILWEDYTRTPPMQPVELYYEGSTDNTRRVGPRCCLDTPYGNGTFSFQTVFTKQGAIYPQRADGKSARCLAVEDRNTKSFITYRHEAAAYLSFEPLRANIAVLKQRLYDGQLRW